MRAVLKRKGSTFKHWDFGFGNADSLIRKSMSKFMDEGLRKYPPWSRLSAANPDLLLVDLALFGDDMMAEQDGPLLQMRLSTLIDNYLEWNDENEEGIKKLRSILSKAIKDIDQRWPPI